MNISNQNWRIDKYLQSEQLRVVSSNIRVYVCYLTICINVEWFKICYMLLNEMLNQMKN
jgi:hypothetical protein